MRIIIFLMLCSSWLNAQTHIDSLLLNGGYDDAIQWIDRHPNKETFEFQAGKVSALISLGQYDDATGLLMHLERNVKNSNYRAIVLNLQGFLYMQKGLQEDAESAFQDAIKLFTESGSRNTIQSARCLSNLGSLYFNSGKFRQAEESHQLSLQIRRQLFGNDHPETAAAYNDLGVVYSAENPAQALEYFERVLGIYSKVYGENHPKVALVSTNMGISYKKLGKTGDAVLYFENALDTWRKIYPQGHPNQALVLSYLGQTYAGMKDRTEAMNYFRRAMKQYTRAYGQRHPDVAALFNQYGLLYANEGNYDSALFFLQEALQRNSRNFTDTRIDFNPGVSDFYNPYVLLYTLQLKAETLELRHYSKTLRLGDLKLALRTVASCDTIIDQIRHQSNNESDKLTLGTQAREIYEIGVRIAQAISEMSTRSEYWKELAFFFAEKSKSGVLLESIVDANARNFSGIPDELVTREKELKAEITLQNRLLTEGIAGEFENKHRSRLFDLNRSYESFISELEKNYPRYYNLKFHTSAPQVQDIRKKLDQASAVVSYFIAEKSSKIFVFTITRNKLDVSVRSLPADFDRSIRGFYNAMIYSSPETYVETGSGLSKILLPDLNKNIKKLILIPSDRLCILPFEALPLSAKINSEGFPVNYWMNRYDIGYEFAAALLTEEKISHTDKQKDILVCAPVDFSESLGLKSLPGTAAELNQIQKLFPESNEGVTGLDATETFFKHAQLNNYRYIHLATHGVVDEDSPELSRIYLNASETDDGKLFSGELFGLSLNADLVTLSACETGLGKLSKGEGVIGLSRALRYAGADKILVSFWAVADESTAALMQNFYQLIAGHPELDFRVALRQAKENLSKEGAYSNPYYWAPFVLVGY